MRTRPDRINSSDLRLDATPAAAMIFCKRSSRRGGKFFLPPCPVPSPRSSSWSSGSMLIDPLSNPLVIRAARPAPSAPPTEIHFHPLQQRLRPHLLQHQLQHHHLQPLL